MNGMITVFLGSILGLMQISVNSYAQSGNVSKNEDQSNQRNQSEKVFGPDDRIGVTLSGGNIPTRFVKTIDAIGIISMGCTGTHLGKGLVLTAGHCFEAGEVLERDKTCSGVTIDWGFRDKQKSALKSKCTEIIAMQQDTTAGIDFAVFKVDVFPAISVALESRVKVKSGDQLTIFSHPELKPLQWSQFCKAEAPNQTRVSKNFAFHRCDTFGGSSGAAVLNAVTGKIVAIHDGGWDDPNGFNYATRLENTPVQAILKGTF